MLLLTNNLNLLRNNVLYILVIKIQRQVKDFYSSDAVLWQAPGKKDRVIVRSESKKDYEQKRYRYLIMSLKEAYRCFC